MKNFLKTILALMAVSMFTLSGCAEPSGGDQFSEVSEDDNEQANEDPHAGHAHPSHGPHGGDLIELGNEEYHAELVHPHGHDDDAHHDDHPEGDKDGEGHKHGKDHDDDGDEHGDKADAAASRENKGPADSDAAKSDSGKVTKEATTEDKPAKE
mgnify:CR=1 FL=1